MRSFLKRAALLSVFGTLWVATEAHAVAPLKVGLLPYISPRQLVETYKPLKVFLEKMLKRQVVLVTARNFTEFARAAESLEYDVYHAPPHFALLAEQKFKYRRLAKFSLDLYGSVVVSKSNPIRSVEELRGHAVAMPDSTAMVTLLGEAWLRDQGLQPGQDVRIDYNVSHSNALLAVINKTADAAVLTPGLINMVPRAQQLKVREIARTPMVAHAMFMAAPTMSDQDYVAVKAALLEFTAAGPGKGFFEATGCGDMAEITDADMAKNRAFVPLLTQRLRYDGGALSRR